MTPANRLDPSQRWALLKTAVFFLIVPGTMAGYLPYRILQRPAIPSWIEFTGLQWAAAIVILAGLVGLLRCGWHFATEGRGTPAPFDAPKALVVRGPYRWVRNPMYVSVATIVIGEALFFRSVTLVQYLATFWLFLHLFVLLYEEPALRSLFGESYEDYCRRVWRWIPRPPRQ